MIGNLGKKLKFGKKINIWKRFGNLKHIWKFGNNLEIWKNNWKIGTTYLEIWKRIEN